MKTETKLLVGLLMFAGMTAVGARTTESQVAPPATTPETDAAAIGPQTAETQAATPGTTPEATAAVSKRPPKDQIRCEYITPLGTRFQKKFCGTEEQWARQRRVAKDVMRYIENQPLPLPGPGG